MTSATGASVIENVQTTGDTEDENLDEVVERYAPLDGAPPLQLVMADLMLVYAPVDALSGGLRGGEPGH